MGVPKFYRWLSERFPQINTVISDSTLSKYMREPQLEGVPHGFRSALRTWLTDHTDISYEIAEMIVAHQVGSQVERAYNRTDYLEQRRDYMELWSVFVTSQTQTEKNSSSQKIQSE